MSPSWYRSTGHRTPGAPIRVGVTGPGLRDQPDGIAITPDGRTVYVANIGSGTVTPIDTATNTPEEPVEVGVRPRAIVITPDGRTAYVVNQSRAQPPPWHIDEAEKRGLPQPAPDRRGTVTPIDTATNVPGEPIDVGNEPFAIAVTPDGKTVYVANTWENTGRPASAPGTVTPIATATNTPGAPIEVGSGPWAFAITPDGKTAYVINFHSHSLTPIATATNTPGPPIPVGQRPQAIAITPDGKTAYVASRQGGTVTPIAIATNTAGTPIEVGEGARAIVITPDGKTAYVAVWGEPGTVTPIATATNPRGRRSRSATDHMRSRSRPEPAIFDLPAARCGPACAGRGLPRPEPGADAGQGAARRRLDLNTAQFGNAPQIELCRCPWL